MKIPCDKQLLKLLRRVSASHLRSCVLSSSVAKLKHPDDVPDSWKAALERQAEGVEPEWRCIWRDFLDLVPSIATFLKTMCLGVRVLECPKKSPSLIYLRAFETDGQVEFSFMLGGAPMPITQLTHTARERFELLPDELQDFYLNVHDGFGSARWMDGISQVESLQFLSDELNEDEWAGPGKKPFRLQDVLMVASTSDGDGIGLNVAKRSGRQDPLAVYWKHDYRPLCRAGLNLWEELDKRFTFEGYITRSGDSFP